MVSPTLTASSTLMPSSVNSVVGMKPEYLVPMSTLISVLVMATTVPVTLSPLYIVLMLSSSISSKDFSFTSTVVSSILISSLILLLTSLIIHDGADAPAVTPTVSTDASLSMSSSPALLTNCTLSHILLQISARCTLLALCFPPITTIASHSADNFVASSCRMDVAPHIVSKISTFVHIFFKKFAHSVKLLRVWVVCMTIVIGFTENVG